MKYITLAALSSGIPGPHLIEALDDNADGSADPDVVSAVLEEASRTVDGILGERFSVPFSNPLPAVVYSAAVVFGSELIYNRRGVIGKDNPFTTAADAMRKRLAEIAAGDRSLGTQEPTKPSGAIISEPSKTHSRKGKTAV